jgi:hypothetical protein
MKLLRLLFSTRDFCGDAGADVRFGCMCSAGVSADSHGWQHWLCISNLEFISRVATADFCAVGSEAIF